MTAALLSRAGALPPLMLVAIVALVLMVAALAWSLVRSVGRDRLARDYDRTMLHQDGSLRAPDPAPRPVRPPVITPAIRATYERERAERTTRRDGASSVDAACRRPQVSGPRTTRIDNLLSFRGVIQ